MSISLSGFSLSRAAPDSIPAAGFGAKSRADSIVIVAKINTGAHPQSDQVKNGTIELWIRASFFFFFREQWWIILQLLGTHYPNLVWIHWSFAIINKCQRPLRTRLTAALTNAGSCLLTRSLHPWNLCALVLCSVGWENGRDAGNVRKENGVRSLRLSLQFHGAKLLGNCQCDILISTSCRLPADILLSHW